MSQREDEDLELRAKMDGFVEDGPLDDIVESFSSHDDIDPIDAVGRCMVATKDGKLLATGGHDKKATDTLKPKSTLEEHSGLITDVRFSTSMSRLATSSFDKTSESGMLTVIFISMMYTMFQNSDERPGYSIRTFMGHSGNVMSLDFHPTKDDLICSCDSDVEIRYWSINNRSCTRVFKWGMAPGTPHLRFQPRLGKYLAAAAENVVSILDTETQTCRHSLQQGHTKPIHFVCWDPSGELLASVSADSVRVWSFASGSEGECVHELSCNGKKFLSCVFHPSFQSWLVIGCYQASNFLLLLWNMPENKTMTLSHEGFIAALAVSPVTRLVSSASHDKFVKLWK
ncbi:hypothetical protein J1N35_045594 [Gossypium stocksii]|uniref:WD-40 repeat family protein n=1 Tax=Gossypium stocksii TaxID=47602 RepID=A0A9D3UBH6_9ROSI|nr:hypothetical protein J1N35_045594 [Gossypium stocksii]